MATIYKYFIYTLLLLSITAADNEKTSSSKIMDAGDDKKDDKKDEKEVKFEKDTTFLKFAKLVHDNEKLDKFNEARKADFDNDVKIKDLVDKINKKVTDPKTITDSKDTKNDEKVKKLNEIVKQYVDDFVLDAKFDDLEASFKKNTGYQKDEAKADERRVEHLSKISTVIYEFTTNILQETAKKVSDTALVDENEYKKFRDEFDKSYNDIDKNVKDINGKIGVYMSSTKIILSLLSLFIIMFN